MATKSLKLDCPGLKVIVRSIPTAQGEILRFLNSGAIIDVKVKESKGFFELADGSVSASFYDELKNIMLFNIYRFIL